MSPLQTLAQAAFTISGFLEKPTFPIITLNFYKYLKLVYEVKIYSNSFNSFPIK